MMDKLDMFQSRFVKIDEFGWWDLERISVDELHDGVSDLVKKPFTPTHVRYKPKIYTGHAVQGGKDKLKGYPSKDE